MPEFDPRWQFFIPFKVGSGGVGVTVTAGNLKHAISEANCAAISHMNLMSHDADHESAVIYFASEEPFTYEHLVSVQCGDCDDQVDTRDGESEEDFIARLVHDEEDPL